MTGWLKRLVSRTTLGLHLFRRRALLKKLSRFRGKHAGRKFLIIGNGPSVNLGDLARFDDFVCIACNRFHLCYDDTDFRPDYVLAIDEQMTADFGSQIHQQSECVVFSSDPLLAGQYPNGEFVMLYDKYDFTFRGRQFDQHVHSGGSVVVCGVQLACFMGAGEIYLYGVDHSFSISADSVAAGERVKGDGNHFIDNYRDGRAWYPPNIPLIEASVLECRKALDRKGVPFINLTPGSRLPHVEQADLESIGNKNHEQ